MIDNRIVWDDETAFKVNDVLENKEWNEIDWDEVQSRVGLVDWSYVRNAVGERQDRQTAVRIGQAGIWLYQSRPTAESERLDTSVELLTRNESGKPKISLAFGSITPATTEIMSKPEDLILIRTFLDLVIERDSSG